MSKTHTPGVTPVRQVTLTVHLTDAHIATMKKFAADHYDPKLGIDWKGVAAGWACAGIEDRCKP